MATSHGAMIDRLLHDVLHGPEFKAKVEDAAHAADGAIKAELAPFVRTGDLWRGSNAEVHEFAGGYGMKVSSFWRAYFVANARGRTLNRHREFGKGRRRGKSAYRRSIRSAHYADHKLSRHAASPSVWGEAIEVFERQIGVF